MAPARAVDGKSSGADDFPPVFQRGGDTRARPAFPYFARKGIETLGLPLLAAEPDAVQQIRAFPEGKIEMPGGRTGKVCGFSPHPHEGKTLLHHAAQPFGQFSYGKNIVHAQKFRWR